MCRAPGGGRTKRICRRPPIRRLEGSIRLHSNNNQTDTEPAPLPELAISSTPISPRHRHELNTGSTLIRHDFGTNSTPNHHAPVRHEFGTRSIWRIPTHLWPKSTLSMTPTRLHQLALNTTQVPDARRSGCHGLIGGSVGRVPSSELGSSAALRGVGYFGVVCRSVLPSQTNRHWRLAVLQVLIFPPGSPCFRSPRTCMRGADIPSSVWPRATLGAPRAHFSSAVNHRLSLSSSGSLRQRRAE